MNESDDFYEDFDVNQTDFDYAMNPGKYRKQTKEQQLYGVFAQSSDEDEDGDGGNDKNKPTFSGRKKKANYTAPVSFVSGGIKKGNKMESADGKEMNPNDLEDEIEEPVRFSKKKARAELSGLGFSGGGHGSQVLAGMRSSQFQDQMTFPDTSSMTWAKSSNKSGVIMQMMQKMGYVHGKGLGSKKQGIVEPVQAFLRPGRGAIGAYGKEVKGPKFGESAADAQNRLGDKTDERIEDNVEIFPRKGNWKKTNTAKKPKIRYRTLDDVVNDTTSDGSRASGRHQPGMGGVKIIDMTGPEQRIYNDFGSFSRRARAPDVESDRTKFDIPQLMYNLNTLVDLTEEEIRKNDRQLRFLKDQTEVLYAEQKRLRTEENQQKSEISHMVEVADIIKDFQRLTSSRVPTLAECQRLFLLLREDYAVEYKLYGLDLLARSSVLPILKVYFSRWDPLDPEQVRYGFEVLEEWRDILSDRNSSNGATNGGRSMFDHFKNDSDSSLTVYDHCVWEGWMPAVRRAALNWNPRDNGPAMMALVEVWLPLLPRWVAENLLDQIIVPRIKIQVDEWDPRLDRVPIDSWLLPWRSVMGDRLLLVYSIIRQKLKKGLENWSPGDRSAIESIRPWKDVFSSGTMHSFLGLSIVPKLEMALQSIDINTSDQFQYLALFEWMEMINADVICQMLIKNFFPKFHLCLYRMLSLPQSAMNNATDYYKMWKNVFPSTVADVAQIRGEFARALMTIHQARQSLPVNAPMGVAPQIPVIPVPAAPFQPAFGFPSGSALPPGRGMMPPPPHGGSSFFGR